MKKILIIEDMKSMREQIISILSSENFDVKGAENGLIGLKIVKQFLPDLVICDIMMPELDGYGFLEQLKQDQQTSAIPCIFLTVKSEMSDIRHGMSVGADDYLIKPFSSPELLEAVNVLLKKQENINRHYTNKAEIFTEERLQHLLSSSPAIIFSHTSFHKMNYISNNIFTIFGYTSQDFIEKPDFWSKKVHPEEKEEAEKELLSIFTTGYYSKEYRFMHKDGTYRWLNDERKVVPDLSKQKSEIVGSWIDITGRKRAEENSMKMAMALEQAGDNVIITDKNLIIEYINPAFENLSGYKKNEVSGKNLEFLKSNKQSKDFYKNILSTITGGNIWKGKITYKKKDSTFYEVKTAISPIKDSSDNIINYIFIMDDITNEIRLEKQLIQAQKMEAIGTLAGGVAHDFNNILAIMMGYTEMAIQHHNNPNGVKMYLEQILKGGMRAKDLVTQILSFSRKTDEKQKPLKLTPIIKETMKLLRATLPTNIEIKKNLNIKEDTIMADATKIHQILMNLSTNAAHAMREKGGILEVSLENVEIDQYDTLHHEKLKAGSYIKLTVSDTGHGMTEEITDHIFDPFFTSKEIGEGTGLGLSVVQGIVKNLNGAITVYSEPWMGTTFHIFIPKLDSKVKITSEKIQKLPSGNSRILFIDDEESLVYLSKDMLENIGHKVTACVNSSDALNIFKSAPNEFDIIITDLMMPNITGINLTKEVIKIRPDIPIIICTGFGDALKAESIIPNIKEIILKPYRFYELAITIQRVVKK